MTTRQEIRFMCPACNGTGRSRYEETRCCDRCDGHGTISSYVALSSATGKAK